MKKILLSGLVLALPAVTLAQNPDLSNIKELIKNVGEITNGLIILLIAVAVVVFFWGLVRFIISAQDEEARKNGKQLMIWGLVALLIMVALWGIIQFFADALGLDIGSDLGDAPGVIAEPEDFFD